MLLSRKSYCHINSRNVAIRLLPNEPRPQNYMRARPILGQYNKQGSKIESHHGTMKETVQGRALVTLKTPKKDHKNGHLLWWWGSRKTTENVDRVAHRDEKVFGAHSSSCWFSTHFKFIAPVNGHFEYIIHEHSHYKIASSHLSRCYSNKIPHTVRSGLRTMYQSTKQMNSVLRTKSNDYSGKT